MGMLFLTADQVGAPTGGGLVAAQESQALREFASAAMLSRRDPTLGVDILSRNELGSQNPEPWKWDHKAVETLANSGKKYKLCHIYSGTWPLTVQWLKNHGTKVAITIAAHDKEVSRKEHEKLGWPFPFPHLIEPPLWRHYIDGYRLADVIVCPSTIAKQTVQNYGPDFANKDIRVIPHGCEIPKEVLPLPGTFVVGYCGSFGADKGVRYLLEAWKKLDYRDGSLLILAGQDSTSPIGKNLLERFGGGSIHVIGWQENLSNFYNALSLYVQPSATEGYGLEVIEAAAHGRPVICSRGAGAVDLVREATDGDSWFECPACDPDNLADRIDEFKGNPRNWAHLGEVMRETAKHYTWAKIRAMYQKVWREVLGWGNIS